MPLSKTGKKMLDSFKGRYGSKGESYFYATLNKHPKIKAKVEPKKPHTPKG